MILWNTCLITASLEIVEKIKLQEMDFNEKNKEDWIIILSRIFPAGIPERYEWKDLPSIVNTLQTIGSIRNSNHMFYPTGGGLDIEGSRLSREEGCIEINTGGLIDVLRPNRLIFHSFQSDAEWFYFRIETLELKPSGVYEVTNRSDEEVLEIQPGEYISRVYWDQGEWQGKELPETARVVTRHFSGSFVIFRKTSMYNLTSSTYDGRHDKMSDDEFREYIQVKGVNQSKE